MFTLILTTLLALCFGWVSRMNGGAPPKLPLGLDAWVFAIPFGILGAITCGLYGFLGAYFTAFLGKRLGHGQYMVLPYSFKLISAEKIDFIVKQFFGDDPRVTTRNKDNLKQNIDLYGTSKLKKRNLCGLAATNFVVALGSTVCLLLAGHFVLGLAVLLGNTVGKPLGYFCGFYCNPYHSNTVGGDFFESNLGHPTALGEFLTGFFGTLPVFFTILTLI